eukprot:COSAG01_NODE_119_length_25410_cov_1333.312275_29_plen_63_part_00
MWRATLLILLAVCDTSILVSHTAAAATARRQRARAARACMADLADLRRLAKTVARDGTSGTL